jgi:hypothetical protein
MKELVGLFMLLYTLGQVAFDRERPEVLLERLDRYGKGKSICVSAGEYTPVVKTRPAECNGNVRLQAKL